MPASRAHKDQLRNYSSEYAHYQGQPAQIHNRSLRNQARSTYEGVHGNLSHTTDVDHRQPLVKGGGNRLSNLRGLSQSVNRSFPRTRTAGMK